MDGKAESHGEAIARARRALDLPLHVDEPDWLHPILRMASDHCGGHPSVGSAAFASLLPAASQYPCWFTRRVLCSQPSLFPGDWIADLVTIVLSYVEIPTKTSWVASTDLCS